MARFLEVISWFLEVIPPAKDNKRLPLFPIIPEFWWSTAILFIINPSPTVDGGPAGGGELYKLTITDGWQWKAPLRDLERSVA